jgi:hypothetical protein
VRVFSEQGSSFVTGWAVVGAAPAAYSEGVQLHEIIIKHFFPFTVSLACLPCGLCCCMIGDDHPAQAGLCRPDGTLVCKLRSRSSSEMITGADGTVFAFQPHTRRLSVFKTRQ